MTPSKVRDQIERAGHAVSSGQYADLTEWVASLSSVEAALKSWPRDDLGEVLTGLKTLQKQLLTAQAGTRRARDRLQYLRNTPTCFGHYSASGRQSKPRRDMSMGKI